MVMEWIWVVNWLKEEILITGPVAVLTFTGPGIYMIFTIKNGLLSKIRILSVSGGTAKTQYNLSVSSVNQEGVLKLFDDSTED